MLRRLFSSRKPRLPKPTPDETRRIEELRASIRAIPAVDLHGGTPAANEWAANRAELRNLILKSDPRAFLTWDVIRKTMLVDNDPYVGVEHDEISKLDDPRITNALKETTFGRPPVSRRLPTSSDNLIHHVYAISKFERTSNVRVDSLPTIVEFGGGYGSMARVVFSLGFRGRYVIFDLPEFSALQRLYLGALGLPIAAISGGASDAPSIAGVSDLNGIGPRLGPESRPGLLIAMWSLSEAPLALREKFLAAAGPARHYLFAYQDQFGEANNNDYFDGLARAIPNVKWNLAPIAHQPGNHHLFGFAR